MKLIKEIKLSRREQNLVRIVLNRTSDKYGYDYFISLCDVFRRILDADYTMIAKLKGNDTKMSETIAFVGKDGVLENITYALKGTPCNDLVCRDLTVIRENVADIYPEDLILIEQGIEGYMGVTLEDSNNKILGLFVALFKNKIREDRTFVSLMKLYAYRTSLELERIKIHQEILDSNNSLIESSNKLERANGRLKKLYKQNLSLIKLYVLQNKNLIKAKEKAEESDKIKTEFISNFSHELRTPLNGILGTLSLIKEGKLTKNQQDELIASAKLAGDRLLRLLTNIVDVALLRFSEIEFHDEIFELNKFLEEKQKQFKLLNNKGLNLKYIGGDQKVIINIDKQRLEQIFDNLIENAIQYTHCGSVYYGFKVLTNNDVEFFVEDMGIGIDEKAKDYIFDLFRQQDSSKTREYEGGGLGLSICKKIVEYYNGKIGLRSKKSKGSYFYFKINERIISKEF